MRLIDADAFEKFIKEKYKDGESTDDIKDQILFDLSYQPTVYDPEAVKKEIDRVGKSFCDYVACNEECTSCEHHSIMNAVTGIVRKGGV